MNRMQYYSLVLLIMSTSCYMAKDMRYKSMGNIYFYMFLALLVLEAALALPTKS